MLLFSCSVMSASWWPHGLQHTRLPYPSPSPGACSNSCSSSQWCHPTISSSVVPFSSCLQSFPASGSFLMSQFFASGGQSIGVSASAVLLVNIQDWFPLGLTSWISLQSRGCSRFFSNTTVQKHQFFDAQLSLWSNSHICTWLLENTQLWLYRSLSAKWCLCFLICSVGWSYQASFNFMAAVTICSDFGAQENSLSLFPLSPHLLAMKMWMVGNCKGILFSSRLGKAEGGSRVDCGWSRYID